MYVSGPRGVECTFIISVSREISTLAKATTTGPHSARHCPLKLHKYEASCYVEGATSIRAAFSSSSAGAEVALEALTRPSRMDGM